MERFIVVVVFGLGLAALVWALFSGMGGFAALLCATLAVIAIGALLLALGVVVRVLAGAGRSVGHPRQQAPARLSRGRSGGWRCALAAYRRNRVGGYGEKGKGTNYPQPRRCPQRYLHGTCGASGCLRTH